MIRSIFIAAVVSISLFSCATQAQLDSQNAPLAPQQAPLNPVYVTNRAKVFPLSPDAIESEVEGYQMFSGHFSLKKREMDFSSPLYLQADKEGVLIMLLTDFGVEAGTIAYDGEKTTVESNFFPSKMKGEYIILDLQNAYYSADALEAHYKKAGLFFCETATGETKVRTISDKNKIIEQITISPDFIQIKNLLRNYEYRLTMVEN